MNLPETCVDNIHLLQGEARRRDLTSQARREASRRLSSYLLALWDAGWPQRAMADQLNVSPQRIQQRVQSVMSDPSTDIPEVPSAPTPEKVEASPKEAPPSLIEPGEVGRLRMLQAQATQTNGATPADHPHRKASVSLTELIAQLKDRGVTVYRIAKILDVTPATIDFRLARHGYIKGPPSYRDIYKGQPSDNPRFSRQTHCVHGHELSGANVRHVNGDERRRVCRTCERRRKREYLDRCQGQVSA